MGGNRFIVLMQSRNLDSLPERAIASFDTALERHVRNAINFLAAGYFWHDRYGQCLLQSLPASLKRTTLWI